MRVSARNELLKGLRCLWTSVKTPLCLEGIYGHSSGTENPKTFQKPPGAELQTATPSHMSLISATATLSGWLGSQITEQLLTFGKHSSFFPTSPFPSFHVVTCRKQSIYCTSSISHCHLQHGRNTPQSDLTAFFALTPSLSKIKYCMHAS